MSAKERQDHEVKYLTEKLRNALDYNLHPEKSAYHEVLKHALELANISGDWHWYERIKRRKVPSIKAYKKFLEEKLDEAS